MKKTAVLLLALAALLGLTACNDYETYGDKKEKERKAIRAFLNSQKISVISEDKFHEQGDVTDTLLNEYVYLNSTGVYMQIVHKGVGSPLRDGECCDLLVRFLEMCLLDSTAIYNDASPYDVDIMNIRRQGNTYTASLTQGLMRSSYNSEAVAQGWLVPFPYINVGRARSATDRISRVRLIVPHSQGHSVASGYVYPYYYELSFQRKTDL